MTGLPSADAGAATRVTAVIVNYRTPELTMQCVDALSRERGAGVDLDAIVVDGGSADGSAERLGHALGEPAYEGWVTFLPKDFNGGFGWANNEGIRRIFARTTPSEFIYLVNPDAIVERGALSALTSVMAEYPRCGAAGSLLLDSNGKHLGSAFRFPSALREFIRGSSLESLGRLLRVPPMVVAGTEPVAVDWVTGASVLLRAEALSEVGLFDEGFFLYFEEVELMNRMARAGWSSMHAPASKVLHPGGASTGVVDGRVQRARIPTYWFDSRRRYFTLTMGATGSMIASLAWLSGRGIGAVARGVGLKKSDNGGMGETADFISHGIRSSKTDRIPVTPTWNSPVDQKPAWATTDRPSGM